MRADETSPATTSNLDQQMKQVADIEATKVEPVKEEGRVEAEKQETPAADTNSADLLPEDIQDRAYPDTPVKELDTTTTVSYTHLIRFLKIKSNSQFKIILWRSLILS